MKKKSFCKKKVRKLKQVLSGSLVPVEGEWYKESVWEGE
jgi:hypothetical protein